MSSATDTIYSEKQALLLQDVLFLSVRWSASDGTDPRHTRKIASGPGQLNNFPAPADIRGIATADLRDHSESGLQDLREITKLHGAIHCYFCPFPSLTPAPGTRYSSLISIDPAAEARPCT